MSKMEFPTEVALSVVVLLFVSVLASTASAANFSRATTGSGVRLTEAGTERVYFTHNDKPLLSFGGQGDFIFYLAEDAYNYKRWADWAAAHGINHVRAYPPLSWKYIEKMTRICKGSEANMLFPYRETSPGSRKFDLTQFDDAYWRRFRAQCEYLQYRGIIIHLLMCSGFHTRRDAHQWPGSFFNPVNNVNDFTDHLPEKNPGARFYVLEEGREELAEAQKAWFRKVIEETHDLDNVYYDLVHEIGMREVEWERLKLWIETMARVTRQCWAELEPEKPIILGMDTGEFPGLKRGYGIVGMPEPGSPMDWMFSRPYFDVLIYGYGHYVHNAWEWRKKYKKPYIGQECWDEDYQSHRYHSGYTYFHSEDRVHIRKYMWKFMMAKCQQMDLYVKTLGTSSQWGRNEPFLNYDPNGWNKFEDDALILRKFWDSLVDYPNLWNDGTVWHGPGRHQYILSSPAEAVIYCSSGTREEGVRFKRGGIHIMELALAAGHYTAEIIQPAAGIVKTETVKVRNGVLRMSLPDFTDDIAVHIYRKNTQKTFDMSKLVLTDIHPHRGGCDNPENTLYGFERNLRDGVSLDMDIRKTAEGDIVVTHDKTTSHTCDRDWIVAQKTVAELKILDAAYLYDPKKDESFPLRGKGITIPTLAEVFRLFSEKKSPGATMWIDTKDDESYPFEENQGLYDRLIELIDEYDLWDEAHIEIASTKEAAALRSRDARVCVIFWARNAEEVRGALNYQHYIRIGVQHSIAASVADQIKASGKKLHVYGRQYTQSEWDELKPHKPDSLGTEHYKKLIKLVGISKDTHKR